MNSMEENDFSIANCINIPIPDCSPAGTSILWFTRLFKAGVWKDVTAANYKATKNAIAKSLIEQYEQATGINIAGSIEEISIATPATFARYLGTPEGIIYGYHGQPWDGILARTMTHNQERWIDGLRFCGGHAFRMPGYGSTYMAGSITANLTAKDIKEE
jgi:prolycopene isomerase